MLVLAVWLYLLGSVTVHTETYQACKKEGFFPELCKSYKKLEKYEKKQ